MINVTKTYLPNKARYKRYVDEIYKNGWITNNGPLLQRLEKKLEKYLGAKNIILVSNGTAALEIAYRTLDIKGDAITTPFSFVATTSSLVTNSINPIFVDIDENTLNIDTNKIEKNITSKTSAIVPVHVFGNACEVEKIERIANKHNLKVIYDASHSFDIKYKNKSLLNYGDISTLSFHATKIFHTIEGGALIINDDELAQKARYLINFGIENQESIPHLGTNAKMNEFEAAMGLCVLEEMDQIKKKRKNIYERYHQKFENIIHLQRLNKNASQNYAYFPIIFKDENDLLRVEKALNYEKIFPRRYFNPSLNTLSYIVPSQECPISQSISKRVLCIPNYSELDQGNQNKIIDIIEKILRN